MKFTNGFWLVRDEFQADYVRDIYEVEERENELLAFAPYKQIQGRGDTLNIGMMTYTFTAPAKDILGIHMVNHAGNYVKSPSFELYGDLDKSPERKCEKASGKEKWTLKSGKLSLEFETGSPEMKFYGDGRELTCIKSKTTGMMHHKQGMNYLVSGLNLGVGELVYGLGERFTPMVKNGQTVDIWNEDGGTASEISYKNIPFYYTTKGYGVFVNHPGRVSFEVGSEKVETVQFSVEDEELEYFVIYGPTPLEIIEKYTALTGRPALPPKWSFGLWLTTSFTTNYDEATVNSFIDGMAERNLPLHVFHFDCFWMKAFQWCDFEWDPLTFPDPEGMIRRLKAKGLKICVWINPYIGQKSPVFKELQEKGYLLKRPDGSLWQWDKWQPGLAIYDFTNPDACKWYADKLKGLVAMGVDCFKTDFGERIPTDVQWFDGSDPQKMHNHYAYIYNELVWNVLKDTVGEEEAVLFARSASVGAQKFPVHWGGDCYANYESMAESLRGGLSIGLSALKIPLRRTFTNAGARLVCSPAIAVYTVANLIVCRGPTMMSPVMWCASSRN